MSLQSIVMQLRKVCNHPYLFGEQRNDMGEFDTDANIVDVSGKLQLLDSLLPRLKKGGHKVLIFSQMTQLMDILEDYLLFREYAYCRLDGSTSHEDRVSQMDEFNENPEKFIFILSTKAGGVGVNLVAADTVVFYDSDWNPHMDLQAQDRVHRIGQKRNVMIYRFVTRPSIEERIIERANSKRKLDRVVIGKGAFKGRKSIGKETNLTVSELKEILDDEMISATKKVVHRLISDAELEYLTDRSKMGEIREGESYRVLGQIDAHILGSS